MLIGYNKLGKVIDIYGNVPMGGVIRNCNLELSRGHLTGSVDVEKEVISEDEFNVDGTFDIEYHTKEKWVKFKAKDAVAEFGTVNYLNGFVDNKRKIMKIDLNSTIRELSGADKYLKKYVDLDLSQWGLKKGFGNLKVNLSKKGKLFEIKSNLTVSDFISNGAKLDGMSVETHTLNKRTNIDLVLKDQNLKGKAHITNEAGKMDIDFRNIIGESSKIFKILEKDLNLKGVRKGCGTGHCGSCLILLDEQLVSFRQALLLRRLPPRLGTYPLQGA